MYKTLDLSSEIKIIISDFDGIFTDNSILISDNGETLKKLSYKDIMGVSVAKKNDIKVAIVSGDVSPSIDFLANRFALEDIHQGIREKLPVVQSILEKYNLSPDEAVYLGDDINDIASLEYIKYSVIPEHANYRVKAASGVQIAESKAGDGLFREVVDNIVALIGVYSVNVEFKSNISFNSCISSSKEVLTFF